MFAGGSVLVTGGAGFVGSALVRALIPRSKEILLVDNFLSAELWNIPADRRVNLIEGSIADDHVLRKLPSSIDHVFHLATFHGNQNSIADPLGDHANNLLTTLKLYERLRNLSGLQAVVYTASGCTLAPHITSTPAPTTEDGPVPFDLDSPYQISKLVGELYSVYYARQHRLPIVRARFQNVYGPGEVLGAGVWRGTIATIWRNVVPTFIYRALTGKPLPLENAGGSSRDFIFVEDIVSGLLLCATKGEHGDVYNLASGVETSIRRLADLVNELTGNAAGIETAPGRSWDRSGRRLGSTEKSRRALGFVAGVPVRQGLEHTINWTRENLDRIEATIAKHAAYAS